MSDRKTASSLPEPDHHFPIVFCCLAFLVLFAELMLAALFLIQPVKALILHAAIVAFLALWVWQVYGRHDHRLDFLLLLMTATLGAFGPGICLAAAISYGWFVRSPITPADWIDSILVPPPEEDTYQLLEDLLPQASSVQPFCDILSSGSVLQKQLVIAKITRYFRPGFAPLLLQAVQDSNVAVRVQAATALAKIERDFMTRYLQCEKLFKKNPQNHALQFTLATLCDEYAHMGLADDNTRQNFRQKAIGLYEAYLTHLQSKDVRLKLARLYLRHGQPEKARDLLKDDVDSGEATPSVVVWHMEALFRLKQFAEIRQLSKRYADALKTLDKSPQFAAAGGTFIWHILPSNFFTGHYYAA